MPKKTESSKVTEPLKPDDDIEPSTRGVLDSNKYKKMYVMFHGMMKST